MLLFVGLGNPGKEYENNRHNIGFKAIDVLLKNENFSEVSKTSFYGQLYKSSNNLFLKPSTYMNLSGKSVQAVANFYKIEPDKIVVIHDDIDLPFGSLKFKIGGGSGGHNGLRSIDSMIGKDYIRCRIGIGKPVRKSEVTGFVLGDFSDNEKIAMDKVLDFLKDALMDIGRMSFSQFQSKYTLKPIESSK
ncbi:MAG: aminoacyl-tRNA hydrolase [Epsilonproteobacteria bacterium]|nr:aminoacyl-tRNA hydrolase [Campylobacterota bacterium]